MEIQERMERALIMQEAYPEFAPYCADVFKFLGFDITWMQMDIAEYMQYGSDNIMVAAQRGEAKSTIACVFGSWDLLHNLSHRVLNVCGSEKKANENGMLLHNLVHYWEPLQYMIPDAGAGQRTSTNCFDIHWALKGVDKSASVTCLGIGGSLQGYRSDLLIPDDKHQCRL